MPLVTVILSTYNWSTVLPFSIESVLIQSFTDFELLVVGDGCTDDSAETVARYTDPRVRWINLPENTRNQAGPNNEGLRQAKGTLIAYLGHDDLWAPDHLQSLVEACSGPEPAFATAGIAHFDETGTMVWLSGIDRTISLLEIMDWIDIPSGTMHSRSLVAKSGYWGDYHTMLNTTPQREFFYALNKISPCRLSGNVTTAKIPAILRKDIYKRKDTTPQRMIAAKLTENPQFLKEATIAFLLRKIKDMKPRLADARLVSVFKRLRKFAGNLGLRYLRSRLFPQQPAEPNIIVAMRKHKGLE